MNLNQKSSTPATCRAEAGFTLVEIMVVIVILGLLATLVARNVIGAADESRLTKAQTDVRIIADGVRSYRAKNGKLPESLEGRQVFVLDPMLATGGSLAYCLELLHERGAPEPVQVVCVLAAPEGLTRIGECGIDVKITTAAIDDHLNDHAYIVPGLGDAGDRQFGLW